MKRPIKKMLSHAALLLFVAGMLPLFAQSEEQIQKFKKERVAYFTERLEFTDAEAKAFWPLYEDFSNRKMKLVEDEKNTIKYAHENADNLSDKEIMETLAKVSRLKEQTLQLEVEYYQDKFLKAIPPKKVLKLGKVEWDFRRHLYRELRGQKDGQGRNGRGGGQGNGPTSSLDSRPGSAPKTSPPAGFF